MARGCLAGNRDSRWIVFTPSELGRVRTAPTALPRTQPVFAPQTLGVGVGAVRVGGAQTGVHQPVASCAVGSHATDGGRESRRVARHARAGSRRRRPGPLRCRRSTTTRTAFAGSSASARTAMSAPLARVEGPRRRAAATTRAALARLAGPGSRRGRCLPTTTSCAGRQARPVPPRRGPPR